MNERTQNEADDSSADPQDGLSSEELDVLSAAAAESMASPDASSNRANVERGPSAATQAASPMNTGPAVESFNLDELREAASPQVDPRRVTMLSDVNLRVKVQLGRTRMLVEDVLKLGEGSVVELDKLAGDPVDILINDRLIARGEVLVLNDNFCVRVSEVLSNQPHRVTE